MPLHHVYNCHTSLKDTSVSLSPIKNLLLLTISLSRNVTIVGSKLDLSYDTFFRATAACTGAYIYHDGSNTYNVNNIIYYVKYIYK